MRPLVLLGLVVFTVTNVLAQPVRVDPPDPRSSEPVTLYVQQFTGACAPPPAVNRSGFDIVVTLRAGLCGIQILVTHALELGALPPGEYHVTVNGGPTPTTYAFTVVDANGNVTVSQSIGSSGGGTIVTVVVAADCRTQPQAPCAQPTITFGAVPATDIVVIDQSHFTAKTPPHAPGAVLVTVSEPGFTKSSYAFRYIDPATPPSSKFFERILVPVIFNGPGAAGSQWRTELSLRNDNIYSVEPWRPIGSVAEITQSRPLSFALGDAPSGLFLVVPREAADNVKLHAAVHDISRNDTEWATEIPVVRENQFSVNTVDLLDVPADPRFRSMLRVYTPANPLLDYQAMIHVIVYSMTDGNVVRDFYPLLFNASGCVDARDCAEHPSFVAVPDVVRGLPNGRYGVMIQAAAPIWAFATVTNNDTQHVSVISPQ